MSKILLVATLSLFCLFAFASRPDSNANTLNGITVCKKGMCESAPVAAAGIDNQFTSFFSSILDTSLWPQRWNCGVWTPLHGWIYILSDFSIWLAYFAIPVILGFFVYKKGIGTTGDIPFKSVIILFIIFILACGLTHLMDAAIFWWPAYKLSALLRFATAAVSLFTVFSLVKVVPVVLELKSPAFLESQVNERTKALQEVNEQLQEEMQERKKISEKMQATNNELMAFSYSVSHDLRAPLRSIHGFSEALMDDYASQLDEEGKDFLMRICKATSRMGELIDDMLKLSKISRSDMTFEPIDLSTLVDEVISTHIQSNPALTSIFEIEKEVTTQGDYKLMKIVIENLIDNAIKYSSKVAQPAIKFGKLKDENIFFIKDNGAGFDMQFADKLFAAFQRLHEGEFDGSGIGLATVQRIISRHGGKIWAESKVNEGATFYFQL